MEERTGPSEAGPCSPLVECALTLNARWQRRARPREAARTGVSAWSLGDVRTAHRSWTPPGREQRSVPPDHRTPSHHDATEDRGGRGSEARVGARLRRMLVSDPSRKSFLELVHTPVEDRGPQDESHASQRRSASKFPLWSDKAREGTSKKPGTSEGVGVKRAQLSGGQRTQVASALRDRFQETH